ncbi:asl7266 (plasmid) [Nostoc sp. PCC 7120 = FACHB-418]|nr:asl7266 [Nostoc sp. PCC 7120 = FACHB-418]
MIMQAIFWTVEEVAQRANQFYENGIRQEVEHGDNIGKMIVIDAETGEYGIDEIGIEPGFKLKQKNPNARLFMMRIGYNAAFGFGGNMERIAE